MKGSIKLAFVVVFLCVVARQTRGQSGHWEESSGDGSGSGSGNGGAEEWRCRRLSDLPGVNRTRNKELDKLKTTMKCHVACMEKVLELNIGIIKVSRQYEIWPSVSNSQLEENCTIYQQVQECRQGCVDRSHHRHSLDSCSRVCLTRCNDTCGGEFPCGQDGSTCLRSCSVEFCDLGCGTYDEMANLSADSSLLPIKPRWGPKFELPPGDLRAGRYLINPRNTSLDGASNTTRVSLTTFAVRVTLGNVITYYRLPSLEDILDLSVYSCREDILVQYFSVNKFGVSGLSDATTIPTVYGESGVYRPENPDDMMIVYEDQVDLRFGYWRRAKIHLVWPEPRGHAFLESYEILLSPMATDGRCGQTEQLYSSSRTGTMATLMARDYSEGPFVDCDYRISVTAIPSLDAPIPAVANIHRVEGVSNPVPMTLSCNQTWNESNGTYQFSASWLLPDFAHFLDAVGGFNVTVTLVVMGLSGKREVSGTWSAIREHEDGQLLQTAELGLFRYHADPEAYYQIELMTNPKLLSGLPLMPTRRQCLFPAMAPPPDAIHYLVIDNNVTRYSGYDPAANTATLSVGVAWEMGMDSSLASVQGYEMRLVEMEAEREEGSVGEEFAREVVTNSSQRYYQFLAQVPSDMPPDSCFYIQVRSVGVYETVSNWSMVECINISTLGDLQDLVMVTTTVHDLVMVTTTMMPEPNTTFSQVLLPILVSSGIGCVVMVSLIVFILVVMLTIRQKNRKLLGSVQENNLSLALSKKDMDDVTDGDNSLPQLPSPHWRQERSNGHSPLVAAPVDMGEWEVHPDQVVVEHKLGQGTFGDVYTGVLVGGEVTPPINRKECDQTNVVIQILPSVAKPSEEEAFFQRVHQAKLVARRRSSHHVLELVGCVSTNKPFALLYQLPSNGDLLSYLVAQRYKLTGVTNGSLPGDKDDTVPTPYPIHKRYLRPRDLLVFSLQIAQGMEALVSLGIVHGDLACRNVYLDGKGVVKITNLGIRNGRNSHSNSRIYPSTENGRRPLKWLSPEAISGGEVTQASDVWAYGVTLWEVVTLGGFPYNCVKNKQMLQHLRHGNRLPQPSNCSSSLYEVMQLCWKVNTHDRPGFSDLKNALSTLRTQQQSVGVVNLNIDPCCSYYKLHCVKKDSSRCDQTQPQPRKKVDEENLTRALEEEFLDGERCGRYVPTDVMTTTRHTTGNHGHNQLPKIEEIAEEEVSREDFHKDGVEDFQVTVSQLTTPHSCSPDDGLPRSPLARKLVVVDMEKDYGIKSSFSSPRGSLEETRMRMMRRGMMEVRDSSSDEGIVSPSVSPVDNSPIHRCIKVHDDNVCRMKEAETIC